MSNATCDFMLYLQSEILYISWIYPDTVPFQYLEIVFAVQYSTLSLARSQFIFLKCDELMQDLRGKFKQKQIYLFWAFWSMIFNFFF